MKLIFYNVKNDVNSIEHRIESFSDCTRELIPELLDEIVGYFKETQVLIHLYQVNDYFYEIYKGRRKYERRKKIHGMFYPLVKDNFLDLGDSRKFRNEFLLYSFNLKPAEYKPSGFVNASKIVGFKEFLDYKRLS